MAKRFSATEIWEEDWFLDMPTPYKLYWFYMLARCDHGGFFKVSLRSFCAANKVKIEAPKALKLFNNGKQRVRVLKDGFWFIEDFIFFQYGKHLNQKNKTHESILNLLNKFNINILSVRGVVEVPYEGKNGSKQELSLGQGGVKAGAKDKDKDKD